MEKKGVIILLFLTVSFLSCKKFIEQQEQNALIKVMTNGVWVVSKYFENDTDISNSFTGYNFQFYSNGTVTGTKNTVSVNGIWAGDISNRTITSNFPTAGDPVAKLNAVWTITDSYTDSVSAKTTINSYINKLELKKH